jgi:hypothetical protein
MAHRRSEVAVIRSVLAIVFLLGTASFGFTQPVPLEPGSIAEKKYLDEYHKLEKAHPKVIYGQGTLSCEEWGKDRAQSTPVLGLSLHPAQVAWVLGFVTGASVTGPYLLKTDRAGIEQWIDSYCAANPLTKVAEAAVLLVVALRSGAQ